MNNDNNNTCNNNNNNDNNNYNNGFIDPQGGSSLLNCIIYMCDGSKLRYL